MADGKIIIDTLLDPHGLEKGLNDLGGLAKAGSKVAIGAVAAIATTVTGLAGAATKVGMTFEKSMSQVAATMGITKEEIANGSEAFEMLEKAAKDAGATTKYSASESAEALNYLALAGYDAEKSVKALPTVLNLASAGGLDLAYASDLVTDSMSALGLGTDELEGFVDKLAKTSQKSNTSVGQLGEAILTVGGTAKSLKGGVTELNTVLGILADNGVKGAEGGTALRNIILSLSAPTDVAAAKLEELGITAFDADGNFRSLDDTFIDFYKALDKLSEQDKKEALSTIFNKVDLKSVEAMLANCGGRFDDLSGAINDSAGAAANMAETMEDNLQGKMTVIGSTLEGLGIQIYERLEGPLKTAADTAIESFSNIAENLNSGELSTSIDAIAEGLGELVTNIAKGVEEWLPKLIDAFVWIMDNSSYIASGIIGIGVAMVAMNIANMTKGLIGWYKGLTVVEGATRLATAAQWLYNAAMTALGGPIVIIIGVIAGLVAGLIYLWKTNDGFREAVISAWNKIKEVASDVWGKICSFFTETIPKAWESLKEKVAAIPEFFGEMWAKVMDKFREWGNNVSEFFTVTIPSIWDNVVVWFNELPYKIGYALGAAIGNIIQWGIDCWNYLVTNVPLWIDGVQKWFQEMPGKIWTWLVETWNKITTWGREMYSKMYNSAKESIDGVVSWFKELPGKVWSWLVETVNKLINWKNDLVAKGKDAAESLFNTIVNKVKELPGEMLQIGKDIVSGIWDGITSMGSWIGDKVGGFFSGLVDGAKKVLDINSPSKVFRDKIGRSIAEGVGVGFEVEMPDVKKDMKSQLLDSVTQMRTAIEFERTKSIPSSIGSSSIRNSSVITNNNNDNGVTQNININQPVKSPAETARAIRRMGKELVFR